MGRIFLATRIAIAAIMGKTTRITRESPGSIIIAIAVPPMSIMGTDIMVRRLIRMKS